MSSPDFYWLRQPLLSLERLLAVLAQDGLADLLGEERVVEAIHLASPAIGEQLRGGWPLSSKVTETVLKYVLRMSTRCTPFGLFAGGGVGYSSERSQLNFTNRRYIGQHRLTMPVLIELAQGLTHQPATKPFIRFYPNPSIYQVGHRIRYTECHWSNGQWHYYASEVAAEPTILNVLTAAREGATLSTLAQGLTSSEPTIEAMAFLDRLIDDDLLQSELRPTPSGPDPLDRLITQIASWTSPPPLLTALREIRTLLTNHQGKEPPTEAIHTLLAGRLAAEPEDLLQTDCRVVAEGIGLSRRVLAQLQRTLLPLHRLSPFQAAAPELTPFKQRFYARYEEQSIPLLQAMDEEIGVGYGPASNPIGDLVGALRPQNDAEPILNHPADALHSLRVKLYSAWCGQPDTPVELTDEDLAQLGTGAMALPASYYALGYFLASSAASIDAGEGQFFLKALSGPSAFPLMGRFCAVDDELRGLVTRQLAQQQGEQPDRVYAEIVHLPQARIGNVVQRPVLRHYDIPYLCSSVLPTEQQIRPDELLISVPQGQRIVLWSKTLGKEVVPQLTTAHDYRTGLPVYRFLCDLQHQDTPFSVGWHWGALAQAKRLPRVQYNNIILQEATWVVSLSDLDSALADDAQILRLQQLTGLPRLIAIQQGDQELFLDLGTPICRALFGSTLRRVKQVRVVEWLRAPERCPLEGPEGKLTHELVIPFLTPPATDKTRPDLHRPQPCLGVAIQRSFHPGSEWLYLKVYCGSTTAGLVLDYLREVARKARQMGQLTHWFFLRYADPEPHIRWRVHLRSASEYGLLLTACQQSLAPLLASGEVHRLVADTYERELERYGAAVIEPTERLFWQDSEQVCRLLEWNLTELALVKVGLLGVDACQTAFGLSSPAKARCCAQLYEALFREHGATAALRQTLAQQYRLNHVWVQRFLQPLFTADEAPLQQAMTQHLTIIQADVATVQAYFVGNDPAGLEPYVNSLTHLFINRLLTSSQRTYELLIYHHLLRAHQTRLAQQRPGQNSQKS